MSTRRARILLRTNVLSGPGFNTVTRNVDVALFGLVLTVIGIALAIWARVYLGRNWGMPMSHKEDPELVTTGPYAYIRHPIYSGMLLAMIGSTLVTFWWGIPLVVTGLYFLFSATREEKLMTEEFPNQYPSYKARTKMLIPFVL